MFFAMDDVFQVGLELAAGEQHTGLVDRAAKTEVDLMLGVIVELEFHIVWAVSPAMAEIAARTDRHFAARRIVQQFAVTPQSPVTAPAVGHLHQAIFLQKGPQHFLRIAIGCAAKDVRPAGGWSCSGFQTKRGKLHQPTFISSEPSAG